MDNQPQLATSDLEIQDCFAVMAELRPHLVADDFVNTVRQQQQQGYLLAYLKDQQQVVAVAGYRFGLNLHMGKHLYVDDLVTASHARSKGYGEILIHWLRQQAKAEGCQYFHLDSGTHRSGAHRFYFRQGFIIASYHFSEKLGKR